MTAPTHRTRAGTRCRAALVVASLALLVGGVATRADAQASPASASVNPTTAAPGATVELTVAGFTHPSDGGSIIAVKIDEGAYAHPAGEGPHVNPTVWALVEADASGAATADIVLPADITEGAHRLNLLTGSIKPGDTTRSVTVNFDVSTSPGTTTTTEATTTTTTPPGGSTATGTISTTVANEGALTISVASTDVALSSPGADGVATGALPGVTVTDLRAGNPGWDATGQSTDFVSGSNSISADLLGWAPRVDSTGDGQTVTAGAPATGLGDARGLASAADGEGRGTAQLGAGLALDIPGDTPAGTYRADIVLTVI